MSIILDFQKMFMHKLYVDLIESIEDDYQYWEETKTVYDEYSNYKLVSETLNVKIVADSYSKDCIHIYVNGNAVNDSFNKLSLSAFRSYIFKRKMMRVKETMLREKQKLDSIRLRTKKNNPEDFI